MVKKDRPESLEPRPVGIKLLRAPRDMTTGDVTRTRSPTGSVHPGEEGEQKKGDGKF